MGCESGSPREATGKQSYEIYLQWQGSEATLILPFSRGVELPRSDAQVEESLFAPEHCLPATPHLWCLLPHAAQIPPFWTELCDLPLTYSHKLFSLLPFPHSQFHVFYSYWFPNPHVPIAALPQTSAALTAVPCSPCQQRKWYLKVLWMFQCEYLSNTSTFKYPEEQSVAVMSATVVCSERRLGPTSHCHWSCPWKKSSLHFPSGDLGFS